MREPTLWVVYAVTFLAFLDTFALLPVLGPYASSVGASPTGVGTVIAAYSASGLVFNLVGGLLLDRVGRRPLAIVGSGIAATVLLLYLAVDSTATLVALRLCHGAGGGLLIPAVFTLAGDLSSPSARGRAMGRMGALIGAAAIVGPAVAGPLRQIGGAGAVFGLLAGALLASGVLVAARVPETAGAATPSPEASPARPSTGGRSDSDDLRLAVAAVFGFTASFGTLVAFLPDQVEARGARPAVSGALFVLISAIAALLMLSPVARGVDRVGAAPPVRAGMACFAVALGLLVADESLPWALAASGVFGVGFGLVFPAATGAVAIVTPVAGRGRAFGVFNAAYSLGFVVGPPVAGAVVTGAGLSPYLLPGAVCLLVLAAAARRRPRRRRHGERTSPARHPPYCRRE